MADIAGENPEPRQSNSGADRSIYSETEPTILRVESSTDGSNWTTIPAGRVNDGHCFIRPDTPLTMHYLKITAEQIPFRASLAVSGVRLFGRGNGEPPSSVESVAGSIRSGTAGLSWTAVPGADGYNVRYGLSPDKLYHSWLVYDATSLEIDTLNVGINYWFAIDAFNENGVTPGSASQFNGAAEGVK